MAGSPTYLDNKDDERDDESSGKPLEHARRVYAHPQDRFVWCIGKVGVPILLKLGAELGHFRRLGAPFYPRVNRASQMDIKSGVKHSQVSANLCIEICFLVFPHSSAAAVVDQS